MMKTCKRCLISKRPASYSKVKTTKDGLQSYCKPCISIRTAEWRLRHPGRAQKTALEYYYANRTEILAKERSKRAINPTFYRKRQAEWAKANPDKIMSYREKDRELSRKRAREYYHQKKRSSA